jgi:hypothetical protein
MILCYSSEDKRKSNDNTFGIPILNSVKTMEEEGLVLNRSLPNNRDFDPCCYLMSLAQSILLWTEGEFCRRDFGVEKVIIVIVQNRNDEGKI